MELKLELVLLPVSDVDRAKTFYVEKVGFNLDVDTRPGEGLRVVQMTRRGRPARSLSGRAPRTPCRARCGAHT